MKDKGKTPQGKLLKKKLLTDQDLMVFLGIRKDSVRRWREKGYLQYFPIGPDVIIYPNSLKK